MTIPKCEHGCNVVHGGEIRHDKNCIFYPESRTEMYDNLKLKYEELSKKKVLEKGFVAVSVEDLHSILESYKCRTEMLLTIEPRLKDHSLNFYNEMKNKYLSEAKK